MFFRPDIRFRPKVKNTLSVIHCPFWWRLLRPAFVTFSKTGQWNPNAQTSEIQRYLHCDQKNVFSWPPRSSKYIKSCRKPFMIISWKNKFAFWNKTRLKVNPRPQVECLKINLRPCQVHVWQDHVWQDHVKTMCVKTMLVKTMFGKTKIHKIIFVKTMLVKTTFVKTMLVNTMPVKTMFVKTMFVKTIFVKTMFVKTIFV